MQTLENETIPPDMPHLRIIKFYTLLFISWGCFHCDQTITAGIFIFKKVEYTMREDAHTQFTAFQVTWIELKNALTVYIWFLCKNSIPKMWLHPTPNDLY